MIEKLPVQGDHIYMSREEIDQWWNILVTEHATYLEQYGIKLPQMDTARALQLIYLKKYEGKLVHKDTISAFVGTIIKDAGKDQQVRHLGSSGWYILNKSDKIQNSEEIVPSGYHILITTESPKPSYLNKQLKRAGRMSAVNFNQLKVVYNSRCATCGSPEGRPNFQSPDTRTILQQGHKNPHHALSLENSIPQCQFCNQVYKDNYVFDDKGRVRAVASIAPVVSAEKSVRDDIYQALKENKLK